MSSKYKDLIQKWKNKFNLIELVDDLIDDIIDELY